MTNKIQLVANNSVGSNEIKDGTFTFNGLDTPWGTNTLIAQTSYPMMVPFTTGTQISVTGLPGNGTSPNAIASHPTLWYSSKSNKSIISVTVKFYMNKEKATNAQCSYGYMKLKYITSENPKQTDMAPHWDAYIGGCSASEDFNGKGMASVNAFVNNNGWNNYGFTLSGYVSVATCWVKAEQIEYLIQEYGN